MSIQRQGVAVGGVVGVAAVVDAFVWLVAGSAVRLTSGVVLSLAPQVVHRMCCLGLPPHHSMPKQRAVSARTECGVAMG
jgi:hypothetical protein